MKIFFWVIAIMILFLIQQGIFIPLGWVLINPVLVFLVLFAIFGDFKESIIFSIIAGLVFDFYSGLPDGIFILTLIIMFVSIRFLLTNFLGKDTNKVTIVLSVIFSSILFVLLPYLFNGLLQLTSIGRSFNQSDLLKNLLLSTFFNILIIVPIYFYFKSIEYFSGKLFLKK